MKPLRESFIKAKDLDNVRTEEYLYVIVPYTEDYHKIATQNYTPLETGIWTCFIEQEKNLEKLYKCKIEDIKNHLKDKDTYVWKSKYDLGKTIHILNKNPIVLNSAKSVKELENYMNKYFELINK